MIERKQNQFPGKEVDSSSSPLLQANFRHCGLAEQPIEDTIPWRDIQEHATLFDPRDPWAAASRAGLLGLDNWAEARVAEVGIGTGVTTGILLREHPEIDVLIGSDLNAHALPVAEQNIGLLAPNAAQRFCGIPGSQDLLLGLFSSGHVLPEQPETRLDRIYACIPQMLVPEKGFTPPPDALAHYLQARDATGVPSVDRYGLALNARLLEQSREALKPDGSVVLTLSGRPPAGVVADMFAHYGFSKPLARHSTLIEQDPGTSIEQLARLERRFAEDTVQFEFWGEDDVAVTGSTLSVQSAKRPMTACEANSVLAAGGKIYHYLHVLESFIEAPAR